MDRQTITIRVRYAETDQSCVVHHSSYPVWFEMGRVELLRSCGITYKEMEQLGFFFVVVDLHVRYRQPARFDDELELETIRSSKTKVTVEHSYKLTRRSDGELLTEGSTLIACINSKGRPCRIPAVMLEAIDAV
jgi:acyl-CoA thioester hydrolase